MQSIVSGANTKENFNSSLISRFMKRMHQSNRSSSFVYPLVVLSIFGGTIYFYYNSLYASYDGNLLSADFPLRSFDPHATDESLAKLNRHEFNYLAMIDAGSSGCRAHVYRYGLLGPPGAPVYIIPQHDSKKVKPGLSSFGKKPTDAGESLQGLVDFMKSQVPEPQWAETPIWLKATAGLRLIPSDESEAVLESVRTFLSDKSKSPFMFQPSHAKIISGNEEGGFGWIAFNYLKKIIGPKKKGGQTPYAVVEMGGASSQVSQIAPNDEAAAKIPDDYKFSFTIEGEKFDLYTHSYLGYGAEQAREALNRHVMTQSGEGSKTVNDPCLNPGYQRDVSTARKEVYEGPDGEIDVIGAANTLKCSESLATVFQNKKTCDIGKEVEPYSFDCVHQPAFVAESTNFLVFENFYYVSSALGIGSKDEEKSGGQFPLLTTPKSFGDAAEIFCSQDWNTVTNTYPKDSQPKDTDIKLCFGSSYANVFLTKGLQLPEDKVLTIQKEVDGSEIEWALGAAYKEVADFLAKKLFPHLRPG